MFTIQLALWLGVFAEISFLRLVTSQERRFFETFPGQPTKTTQKGHLITRVLDEI